MNKGNLDKRTANNLLKIISLIINSLYSARRRRGTTAKQFQ